MGGKEIFQGEQREDQWWQTEFKAYIYCRKLTANEGGREVVRILQSPMGGSV